MLQSMTLSEYIAVMGARKFAALIGITLRATHGYQFGDRTPRREVAQRIVALTPVTWEGIFNDPRTKKSKKDGAA